MMGTTQESWLAHGLKASVAAKAKWQVVGVGTKRALERLARHYAVSQRATLEKVLGEADKAVSRRLDDAALKHYVRDGK